MHTGVDQMLKLIKDGKVKRIIRDEDNQGDHKVDIDELLEDLPIPDGIQSLEEIEEEQRKKKEKEEVEKTKEEEKKV